MTRISAPTQSLRPYPNTDPFAVRSAGPGRSYQVGGNVFAGPKKRPAGPSGRTYRIFGGCVCGAVAAGLLLFSAEHWTTAQQLGKTAIAAALAFVSIACLKPGR